MQRAEMGLAEIDANMDALVETIAADLHPDFGGGALSPSAYDTAWVARVRDPHDPQKLAFPLCFEGLFDLQCADGSFGAPFPYTVVPTLAALVTLKHAPNQDQRTQRAAHRAQQYLERVFPDWDVAHHDTVAFEVLVPQLLRDLAVLGIEFAFPQKTALLGHYEKKMALIPRDRLYEKRSTLAFSLDAFPGQLDFARLKVQRGPDGSYGGSPASTAAMLIFGPWDGDAAAWLQHLYERGCCEQPGLMPSQFALECVEICWTLHYFKTAGDSRSGRDMRPCDRTLEQWLQKCLTPSGAAWYVFAAHWMPDADDTALALLALMRYGLTPDLTPLLRFELSDHFLCFEGERTPSTSTNAHVLDLLLALPPSKHAEMRPRIEKAARFLIKNCQPDGYWTDKWHASPLYATSCAVMALADNNVVPAEDVLDKALRWTLDMQHEHDGGWGMLGSCTAEETAYALMILFAMQNRFSQRLDDQVRLALQRGMTYLRQHADPPTGRLAQRPSLWIAKDLYTPCRVVEAAILAMLRRGIEIPSTTTNAGGEI